MDAWTEIEKAEEQFLSNLAENGGLHPDLAGMLRHCSRFIAGLKRRAAAAAPQAAPAGMVLVPRERNIDDDPGDYESADPYSLGHCDGWNDCRKVMLAAAPAAQVAEPIPMILLCPSCGKQHIDAPETRDIPSGNGFAEVADWTNPPHRSHLCHACGCIWRPADVPTVGVERIETRGKADTYDVATAKGAGAHGPAVSWRVRVLHKPLHAESYWSRWQEIDSKSFAEAKNSGAYYEYDTIELQELGVLAAAPAMVVDEAMVVRACNAYDASREDGNAAEFVGMHAALAAALNQGKASG